jgi:TetR/AcrR family transcriptional regulator, cholesterol catabolism regulator
MATREVTASADDPRPTLSRSQAARRSRVLQAAIELAAEGGYDAVQMRDVSNRADVALGTIYRYFSSKDHLLASVWVDWMGDLRDRVSKRPPQADSPVDRVMDVLNRASRAIVRQPEVTAALVTALSAADPMVIECQRETSAITDEVLSLALPEIDEVTRLRIIRVLGHVWYSALVGWVNGWSGIDDIPAELELAAHMLLDHRA